jgi:hypothetical protein
VRCGTQELIINKELGLAKNENPLQGSFIIEELTDLVEEAVLTEPACRQAGSTASPNAAACWAPWRRCTKEVGYKRRVCTTKC